MKGAGMRWTTTGAQQAATLRMLLLSDRWQEVADQCRTAAYTRPRLQVTPFTHLKIDSTTLNE